MRINFKKTLMFLVLGMTVLAILPSCKKEKAGVYAPKKKIQRVYVSTEYPNKYLNSIWNWEGNLLKTIDYYAAEGGKSWTESFSYEGKRLSRVDDYANAEYVLFEYDGNNLKSASYYHKNNIEEMVAVTYTDKKISSIEQTYYLTDKGDRALCHLNPLSMLFPSQVCDVMEKGVEEVKASRQEKEIYTINWQLTWTDDNITGLTETYMDGDSYTVTLQYDAKNSVYKGFMNLYSLIGEIDSSVETGCFSKNNVTKIINNYAGEAEIINLTYQYDSEDYPTMITESYEGTSDTFMTYYEYE